ncbi:hypothetical protein GOV04_01920 [Candidatus Woesearchaeota archaeon]|nr:hypothetical protein [Candidatus Woesearchaeota archaeon]
MERKSKNNSKRILLTLLILFWPAGVIYYFIKRKDIKEVKEKVWFLDHPFLTWLIVMFAFGMLLSSVDTPTITSNSSSTTNTEQVQIINENFAEFKNDFWSMTDLQREKYWDEVDGKYVKWTFYVNKVDEDIWGTLVVLGSASKQGEYDIGSDTAVKFTNDQKNKLLQYSEGDVMTVTGKLSYYGNIMKQIDLSDAKVMPTEQVKYASGGENSQECQELKDMCSMGIDCTGYLMAQNEGLC